MNDPYRRSAFTPALFYKDPVSALDWLERAFGFERSMVITDSSGALGHAEMRFGDGTIYVGGEWADFTASAASAGGKNTQLVHVRVQHDIDGHCERARRAGAVIVAEPEEQFYGDRTYRARDPEGHNWTFAQPVRAVSREEAEKGERPDDRRLGVSTAVDLDRVLAALADPRRRQVVELLRERPRRAGELAEAVRLSPAALTRHLRALKQGGIVEDAHPAFDARVRVFSLRPEPMAALKAWLGETERLPSDELAAFKAHVERSGP